MTAAITHVAKSATFTPSGGSAWNITDLTEISDSEAGDMTELTTDGSVVVNGMFINSIKGTLQITSTNLGTHTTNAGAAVGATGSLAVVYAKRAAGKGNVASNDLTVTYAASVLESISRQSGVIGNGTFVVAFRAYGTDGATIKTAGIA